jgi:hypothetical protein
VTVVCLTEVFRQAAESRIIANAHLINHGSMPNWARDPDSDFHFVPCRDAEDGTAKIVEIVRDRIPARFHLDPIREVQGYKTVFTYPRTGLLDTRHGPLLGGQDGGTANAHRAPINNGRQATGGRTEQHHSLNLKGIEFVVGYTKIQECVAGAPVDPVAYHCCTSIDRAAARELPKDVAGCGIQGKHRRVVRVGCQRARKQHVAGDSDRALRRRAARENR